MQFSEILDIHKYFDSVCEYLAEFDWIYNFQPTCFFNSKVWEKLPKEWNEVLLNSDYSLLCGILNGNVEDHWPITLKNFIQKGMGFNLNRKVDTKCEQTININKEIKRGMSPKKQHEVIRMAAFVNSAIQRTKCDIILDVGAGLGYLDEVLYHTYGYKVIGIESSLAKSYSAEKRFKKSFAETSCVTLELQDDTSEDQINRVLHNINCYNVTPHQKHIVFKKNYAENCISEFSSFESLPSINDCLPETVDCINISDSSNDISLEENKDGNNDDVISGNLDILSHTSLQKNSDKTSLDTKLNERLSQVCMIGLHSCGDLIPIMLKIFSRLPSVHLLVGVGCCYHKMKLQDDGKFSNFPLSRILQESLTAAEQKFPAWKINVFTLRLAAQETKVKWFHQSPADHKVRMKHIIFRAVLETFIENEGVHLSKAFRRAARKHHFLTFEAYIEAVYSRFNVPEDMKTELKDKLMKVFEEYSPYFPYVEVIWTLQTLLQGIIECLILMDRYLFLKEHGLEAELIPIFNDYISPRNVVLCAWKNGNQT